MGFRVTFQGLPDSDHQGDDTFEILDGGVLKVETTRFSVVDGGPVPEARYFAPAVWRTVVDDGPSRGLWDRLQDTIGGFLGDQWRKRGFFSNAVPRDGV